MAITELVLRAPESFSAGFKTGKGVVLPQRRTVVAVGMGGSILAAELTADLLKLEKKGELELMVWSDYLLPELKGNPEVLVLCFSYSGNTEETLSAFQRAKELQLPVFGFGRGGKLKELGQQNFVELPEFPAPRFAVPYFWGLLWGMLGRENPFPQKKLELSSLSALAIQLVMSWGEKMVLLYHPRHLTSLAHCWELNLEETAKIPVFAGEIPEIDHHELVGLSQLKMKELFAALFLQDSNSPKFLSKRFELTAKFFEKELGIPSSVLTVEGEDYFEKFFKQLILSYLSSLRLAELRKVDPLESTLQERLKKELAR